MWISLFIIVECHSPNNMTH